MNGPTAEGHRRPDRVKNAVKGSSGQILAVVALPSGWLEVYTR